MKKKQKIDETKQKRFDIDRGLEACRDECHLLRRPYLHNLYGIFVRCEKSPKLKGMRANAQSLNLSATSIVTLIPATQNNFTFIFVLLFFAPQKLQAASLTLKFSSSFRVLLVVFSLVSISPAMLSENRRQAAFQKKKHQHNNNNNRRVSYAIDWKYTAQNKITFTVCRRENPSKKRSRVEMLNHDFENALIRLKELP